jgi:hypothetical protein
MRMKIHGPVGEKSALSTRLSFVSIIAPIGARCVQSSMRYALLRPPKRG